MDAAASCAQAHALVCPRSCMGEDGADDPKKGTQLLEVYALEIQMHSEQVLPTCWP